MTKEKTVNEMALDVIEKAIAKRLMLVLAESCTGGMIAAALTDIAGSSAVVERGLVTYSNSAKVELLAVPAATLETHGAVSVQTATAMAAGALGNAAAAQIALSVTGIAGPGGGSPQKPVGLVHFAVAHRSNSIETNAHIFAGTRAEIRHQALETGLRLLCEAISKY